MSRIAVIAPLYPSHFRTLRLATNPGGPLGLRRVIDDMGRTTDMLCREVPAMLDALHIDVLICGHGAP
ncbi:MULTISPECIES: hypothetical protein [Halomonadaceae]|uniref:hypothetical protein n=1 Tax=Halomonadaceae TaxID=28256 RepID=UPI00159A772E|nr:MULTISPECIES: hypothetical protein [Halomonas]QJQ96343.1 hypothetical protein HIO72_14440 [Halomonas sp. PA5]